MSIKNKILSRLSIWQLSTMLCAVAILTLDFADSFSDGRISAWQTWITEIVGIALITFVAWKPKIFAIVFICYESVIILAPSPWGAGATAIFVYVVIGYYTFMNNKLLAMISGTIILITDTVGLINNITASSIIISDSFFIMVAGIIGMILKEYDKAVKQSREEAERNKKYGEQAINAMRENLANSLHDKSVAELSRVVMLCESLSLSDSNNRDNTVAIVKEESRLALKHLRETIRWLSQGKAREPSYSNLEQILERCQNIVLSYGIKLEMQVSSEFFETTNAGDTEFFQILITELTTNLIKFGERNSYAKIDVEISNNGFYIISTNRCSLETHADVTLSSGTGLNKINTALQEKGGYLKYSSQEGIWLLVAFLPS